MALRVTEPEVGIPPLEGPIPDLRQVLRQVGGKSVIGCPEKWHRNSVFLTMLPLSQGEIAATGDGLLDRSFADSSGLLDLGDSPLRMDDYLGLICRGGFPEPVRTTSQRARHRWFSGHVSSVATKEITRLEDVRDADLIPRLLRLVAARSGSEFVTATVARAADCDRRTVDRYVSLMEMTGLIHRLGAWSANLTARESRREKLLICDSGLAAHLLRKDPGSLADLTDPARGPLVELFALNELRKQALLSVCVPDLFHYRDHRSDVEVDLVTEAGGVPVLLSSLSRRLGAGFRVGASGRGFGF